MNGLKQKEQKSIVETIQLLLKPQPVDWIYIYLFFEAICFWAQIMHTHMYKCLGIEE